ncbi:MAG TPA: hypothetical protein PLR60_00505 [Syntrophorhabdaceae bacterium]|nr:hypothetical protein [Syntrophorhabdaceae bacterium]
MNKRAIQKAFFVCAFIGLTYAALAFNIQDRFVMKRTFDISARPAPKGMSVAAPGADTGHAAQVHQPVIAKDSPSIEPSLLIAIPIVASSIKEGLIEKEGLILIKKDGDPSRVYLKKPFDILRDKDREGLKSLSRVIGKKNIEAFLKKEGIVLPDRSLPFDTMTGKGFSVDKKVLTALYGKHVTEGFDSLFPFADGAFEVRKQSGVFEITSAGEPRQGKKAESDTAFDMPDLSGLSMKAALDMLAPRTQKIKIYGWGTVADQLPKPQEQVRGDTQCVLYGRSNQR